MRLRMISVSVRHQFIENVFSICSEGNIYKFLMIRIMRQFFLIVKLRRVDWQIGRFIRPNSPLSLLKCLCIAVLLAGCTNAATPQETSVPANTPNVVTATPTLEATKSPILNDKAYFFNPC